MCEHIEKRDISKCDNDSLIHECAHRAWNAETAITGGLVGDDLVSILWNKIAALTGGTTEWPFGLGLRPWYLQVTSLSLLSVMEISDVKVHCWLKLGTLQC